MTDDNHGPIGGRASASGMAHREGPTKVESKVATTSDIKQKLSDDVSSASDFARHQISDASEQAKEAADSQKNVIAGKMSGVALAISKVADELEEGDDKDIGKLARTLGSTMKSFSDDIQGRNLGEIAGMAEDFGRRQPIAFLGLAAVAGLAASRFLTASAQHDASPTRTPSAKGKPDRGSTDPVQPKASPSNENSMEGRING